jgi:hypothetical protein
MGMSGAAFRSQWIVMGLALAWLPFITTHCIDPASCPTEHMRSEGHHDDHHGDHAHSHGDAAANHGTRHESPPSTPARACCNLTGKFNILASAGPPSVAPVFSSTALAAPVVPELRNGALRSPFIPHTAHAPPLYLRNHTLLI